jgi:hypothetical protein
MDREIRNVASRQQGIPCNTAHPLFSLSLPFFLIPLFLLLVQRLGGFKPRSRIQTSQNFRRGWRQRRTVCSAGVCRRSRRTLRGRDRDVDLRERVVPRAVDRTGLHRLRELSHHLECGAHQVPLGDVHLRLVHPLPRLAVRIARRLDLLSRSSPWNPARTSRMFCEMVGYARRNSVMAPKSWLRWLIGLD